jgi:hypothetical protein
VVPNLFINRANIGDKTSWRAYFGFENKNISRIALFEDIKGAFAIQINIIKVLRAFQNTLVGKNIPAGTRLGSAALGECLNLCDDIPIICKFIIHCFSQCLKLEIKVLIH